MDYRLHVQLLGGFAVTVDNEPLRLPARKERWLLALLVLANGQTRTRQALQDDLWPQGPDGDPAYNLRRSLSHLRKALGEHAYRLQTPTRETLRFDLNGVFVDALAFDQATQDEHALALYAGALLPECEETWVLAPRQRLHQKFLDRLARLAEERLRSGDLEAVPALLHKALSFDPLWEAGRRLLMRVHAARGEPHEALLAYQELVRLLARTDPRLVPDPETTALWRQIRDQARSGRPAPSAAPVVASLPAPRTRLIGREEEIAQVMDRLASSRLVTLTGAGGCGKTRLALEVAHRLAASFGEGVCWVELASLSNPDLVAASVAAVLEVKEVAGEPIEATLLQRLRNRHLLLILDNCEHLLEAVAMLVDDLLGRCPSLWVLATSRERLNLSEERLYRVPSLSVPPLDCSAEGLLAFESSCLFLDRAQAMGHDLSISASGARALASVCRRLDGIPLAIELAAARVGSLGLVELERRLADRFALLMGGSRNAPSRHQTLRSLTEWSYDLLSDSERLLFNRLSVFSGGWTLDSVEFVCGVGLLESSSVVSLLSSLVEKCLVEVLDTAFGVRYRYLETVRQFALERLSESGEEETLRDRHLEFFLAAAEATREEGHLRDGRWADAMEVDHDNLRSALRHAEKHPPQVRLRLACALRAFWLDRGHGSEGRECILSALAASDPSERTALRAEALVTAAWLGGTARCALLEEALAIYREQGDQYLEADVLNTLSWMCYFDDYARARALSEQAWALCNELGEPNAGDGCLYILCTLALEYCDFETAWKYLARAKALGSRHAGVPQIEIMLLFEAGEMESAREACEAWLVWLQSAGIHAYVVWARMMLGDIDRSLGEFAKARTTLQECLQVFWEQENYWHLWGLLGIFASLVWVQDRSAWAPRLWGVAAGLNQRFGFPSLPLRQRRLERDSAPAREAQGEAAFAAAYEEGRRMPLEAAVEFALAWEPGSLAVEPRS